MLRSCALILALIAVPALAQQQQAGNEASTNTEETFQALIEQCNDTEALMLRARIRLQLPRTTEEAAAEAQTMLDEGFAACGAGDLEGAKTKLAEALAVAEAGVTENFGTDASAGSEPAAAETGAETQAEPAAAEAATAAESAEPEEAPKPWWQFW
ncbi:MAG: hypothetical protein AAFV49_11315 [Pseudomonadota bacterium]